MQIRSLPALQCGHATVIKVLKQALRERNLLSPCRSLSVDHYLHYNVVMLQLSRFLNKHSKNADLAPWPMENIIPILPQKLWIITCTTISGQKIRRNPCKDFSNDFASRGFVT